jgi:hypothetical protein
MSQALGLTGEIAFIRGGAFFITFYGLHGFCFDQVFHDMMAEHNGCKIVRKRRMKDF